ncbi:MAG: tRNA (guanosine(46)-N7)-methyltransferase TrmB [Halieaceae bacterium]|jgi:tRNA (guanine-N7-)-methyltransferase|nr:tRNA (guanosine(46)-N7)-methyltransferase TrmB [Halieaceae bacterium]
MIDTGNKRPIRSYVLRMGRMTPAQRRGMDIGWPKWGLAFGEGLLDFDAVFEQPGPRVLEIGFGMGQSLVAMGKASPDTNFIGIEVHRPGVGKLMHSMLENGVDNIRVYCHDAVEILRDCIPPESLDTVQIFFPDPWHKKRHHKRRLIQPPFLEQLQSRLKPGGLLHLATDWEDYALQMMSVLGEARGWRNRYGEQRYAPRLGCRPPTNFERRGERMGHGVWDLMFERTTEVESPAPVK